MRIAGLLAVFVTLLLAGLLAGLPLRMGLAAAGAVPGGAIYGTVWDGRIFNAAAAGRTVDEIRVALSPLPLLSGRLSLDWQARDALVQASGRFDQGPGGRRTWRDTRLVAAPGLIAPGLGNLFEPADVVMADIASLSFTGHRCETADGFVRTDALYNLGQRLGAALPALEGRLRCEAGALHLLLAGEAGDADVRLDLVLDGSDWRWTAWVRTRAERVGEVLRNAGFTADGDVWTLDGSGSVLT